jgi:hypothetical protein
VLGIRSSPLPPAALLGRYQGTGAYVDCYVATLGRRVSLPAYIEAFYTSSAFKGERLVLRHLLARPATDEEIRRFAAGERQGFAAWTVEARATDQVLLADFSGRTRSWLMVAEDPQGAASDTRLYFGSAVVPVRRLPAAEPSLGPVFWSVLGLHKLYSRILLDAARRRLSELRD